MRPAVRQLFPVPHVVLSGRIAISSIHVSGEGAVHDFAGAPMPVISERAARRRGAAGDRGYVLRIGAVCLLKEACNGAPE
jgi:hypothetical protein